jgi:CBS domain-containing protein
MHEEHLRNINEQIDKGVDPSKESVRTILSWFYASRRGYNVVKRIRSVFKEFNLTTTPNFEIAYIDELVQFARPDAASQPSDPDPIFRIGRLGSANRKPISVKPDVPLATATTLMLTHDYSQLPVMTTDRDVKGVISWRTIGSRLSLDCGGTVVSDFMEESHVIPIGTSLFDAINSVSEHGHVLVQAVDRTICGIVTAADLTIQFRNLAEPFLLIGEIENHIRKLIHGKFTAEELQEIRNPNDPDRVVECVADLTFGEYLRLIENEDRWAKLGVQIDRVEFTKRLDQIRVIRNDVMHFDPDGLSDDDVSTLQGFASFLRTIRNVGAF